MTRPAAALIALGCALALAGCGGSGQGSEGESTTTSAAPPETLEALWRGPGEDVAIVAGTSDFGPGTNRVSFLVVDKQSKVIERPTARVWISHGLKQKPYAETAAKLEPIGVPGGATAEAQNIYVTSVDTPTPGTYWILAEPVGGKEDPGAREPRRPQQAAGAVGRGPGDPLQEPHTRAGRRPEVGHDGRAARPRPPCTTVAAAMAAKRPFVVTFATPLYCQTRTCGPVVQITQSVAKKWQGKGVDFIHIEIYKGNDPANGTNRWVDEWKLPTEPFTFVVDRTGVIRTGSKAPSARQSSRRLSPRSQADARSAHRPEARGATVAVPGDYAAPVSRVLQSLPVGERIGIAFSGGLDTSVAVAWIREKGGIPYALTADLGQVDEDDVEDIRDRALTTAPRRPASSTVARARARGPRRAAVRCLSRLQCGEDVLQHDPDRPRGHGHDAGSGDGRHGVNIWGDGSHTRATTSSGSSATASWPTPTCASTSPGSIRSSSPSSADARR